MRRSEGRIGSASSPGGAIREAAPLFGNYLGLSAVLRGEPDIATIARRAPRRAGDLAFRLFCMPQVSEYRTSDHALLTARSRHHLAGVPLVRHQTAAGEVVSYELLPDSGEPRGHVLVIHGWTSEASFMMGLAEPLRRSGFRVVLVDCPAHGRTRSAQTNLIACALAVAEVALTIGPFDAVVAHSMGALAALLAGTDDPPMRQPVAFSRYVLIAAPNRFSEVTGRFARRHGLPWAARRQFERHLERLSRRDIAEFRADAFLSRIGSPALVVHARDDMEVPFHNAREIADVGTTVTLVPFDGLGHRKILYAPPVVRTVVNELRSAFL